MADLNNNQISSQRVSLNQENFAKENHPYSSLTKGNNFTLENVRAISSFTIDKTSDTKQNTQKIN